MAGVQEEKGSEEGMESAGLLEILGWWDKSY